MPQPTTTIFRTRQRDPQLAAKAHIRDGETVQQLRGWHTVGGATGPAVQIMDADGHQRMIVVSVRTGGSDAADYDD